MARIKNKCIMKIVLFDYNSSVLTLLAQYRISGEIATCVRMLNMIIIFKAFVSCVCTVSIKNLDLCCIARLKFIRY